MAANRAKSLAIGRPGATIRACLRNLLSMLEPVEWASSIADGDLPKKPVPGPKVRVS